MDRFKMELDETDKRILIELQNNLPVVKEPFLAVARKVGIDEDTFFRRVRRLIDRGIIRKFGLRIDSKKVGFKSTLVALKVPEERLDETGEKLNEFEFVTHNYAREHEYNIWFTIIEKDEERLERALKRVEREIEYDDMLNLPVQRKFKINVRFNIK